MSKIFRCLLYPFSILYGLITWGRNKMFDWNLFKEVQFNLPVISIGNITVGGTGKTPHAEYIINLLGRNYKLAMLSRGYKRKSSGYVLADKKTRLSDIGDEPYQVLQKFEDLQVAVCEKRVEGIRKLCAHFPRLDAIILDDSYQHRHVKPGLSILLVDYNRPIYKDCMLPAGNLREYRSGLSRADVVMVTKVPNQLSGQELQEWRRKLNIRKGQYLFFSCFKYGAFTSLMESGVIREPVFFKEKSVLVIVGVAFPKPFFKFLSSAGLTFAVLEFGDHHDFSSSDNSRIQEKLNELPTTERAILTTEKDAVRMKQSGALGVNILELTYYVPIEVEVMNQEQTQFDNIINDYVRKD